MRLIHSVFFLAAAAVAASGVACGGRSGGKDAGSVAPDNSFLAARSAQVESATHCNCFTAIGYPSQGSCQSDTAPDAVTDAQSACVEQLYVAYSDEMNARFRCIEESNQNYHTCMLAVTACETTAVSACVSTLSAAASACPALPTMLQDSLAACLAPPP